MFSVWVVLSSSGLLWNSVAPAHSILLYLVSCVFLVFVCPTLSSPFLLSRHVGSALLQLNRQVTAQVMNIYDNKRLGEKATDLISV